MPQDGRYYGWCFTINNPTEQDKEELKKMQEEKVYKYLVFGREKGEEEETPHYQGYVLLKLKKALTGVKKMLTRAHLEPQRGNFAQAIEYCKKEGDFYEDGEPPMDQQTKGKRGREFWEETKDLAKKGKLDEIDPKVYIQYYKSLQSIAKDHAVMPPDAEDTTGEWYYGETGTGKSYEARNNNPGFYLKMCNKWWDNYQGEEVAIIEDFDKQHQVLGYYLKIWADRYAFPAEIKGGKINIRPSKIIVTSNWHPNEIWTERQTIEPILRRFKIKHFH